MDAEVVKQTTIMLKDYLVIIAIIIAPISALQIQKYFEKRKEEKERKMSVFRVLMSTRTAPLNHYRVEALNRIDIEFYKNKEITEAWHLLLDSYESYPNNPEEKDYDASMKICINKSIDLYTDLLYEMSQLLSYNKFDKVLLKRGCYIPRGHGEIESEQIFIRKSITELFEGKKTIPIKIIEKQKKKIVKKK